MSKLFPLTKEEWNSLYQDITNECIFGDLDLSDISITLFSKHLIQALPLVANAVRADLHKEQVKDSLSENQLKAVDELLASKCWGYSCDPDNKRIRTTLRCTIAAEERRDFLKVQEEILFGSPITSLITNCEGTTYTLHRTFEYTDFMTNLHKHITYKQS